jgi:ribonucleoside-diphosphate reductase alpha chain
MDPQEVSIDVLIEKYAKGEETNVHEVRARVAKALAAVEAPDQRGHYELEFLKAMEEGFIPAGRISSAAGSGINATLINCFVQPVGDAVSEPALDEPAMAKPSIYKAVAQAAETMRRGGGVGYDFSEIRPSGALVRGTHSRASGPVSFMKVFDASCQTVESAGARRGAQMGVLRCDHPDIEAFIHAKHNGELTNFNISLAVTDALMQAVKEGADFELVHRAQPADDQIAAGAFQREDGLWVYRKVAAAGLWDQVMQATYRAAEPGVIFIDRVNAENNLWYCERLEATNPCGEQPLPDYGCCCLGSINLTRVVSRSFLKDASIDWQALRALVRLGVRMLDNVLQATFWPLAEQREEAMAKRRIGLGFLGLGSALVMLGLRYDSAEGRLLAERVAREIRDEAYRASIALGKERGAFPLFEADKYLSSGFAMRLPADIRAEIRKSGIRNSHLLSIAPTGTITLAFADNASNGIEPAFSWVYNRKKRVAEGGHRMYEVADHAFRLYRSLGGDVSDVSKLPHAFVTALDMAAIDHMRMLEVVQPYVDAAISKTVNVPEDYPYDDFKGLYFEAWEAGLKGITTYRPNAILGQVLSLASAAPVAPARAVAGDVDPLRVQFDNRPQGDLEGVTTKAEYFTHEGKRSVYLTTNFTRVAGVIDGKSVTIERPLEFFMPAGQRTEGQQWITSTMRLLSRVARSGGSVAQALADMREVVWDKGPVRCGYLTRDDGTRVPMHHDSEAAAVAFVLQTILQRRGFLDADFRQVPASVLARQFAARSTGMSFTAIEAAPEPEVIIEQSRGMGSGKKCPDCGAHELHKVDGCQKCLNCGHIGECG